MGDPVQLQKQQETKPVNDPSGAAINATATKQITSEQNINARSESQQNQESETLSATASQLQTQSSEDLEKARFESREKERWNMVSAFRKVSGEAAITGSDYKNEYGQMDLIGLRDALEADEKDKSKLFMKMFNSLDALLKLSATEGKTTDENGAEISVDFARTLLDARQATHIYLNVRTKQIHIFDNGKRRLDIAERVERLLDELSDNIDKRMDSLSEEERRLQEYKRDGLSSEEIEKRERIFRLDAGALDARRIIETGEFGPKLDEKTKARLEEKWIAGNFTDKLMELLGNPEKLRTKEEKNDFLAAITDRNNLLLANKMTITLLTESDRAVSLGIPAIKQDIKKYVASHLTDEELLTMQPEEIAGRTRQLMDEYAGHYREELDKVTGRRIKLMKLIPVDVYSADQNKMSDDIYAHPDFEKMVLYTDDAQFEEWVSELARKVEADDRAINEQLLKYYSRATVRAIRLQLNARMAGLRLFGSTEAILDQTGIFRQQLQYLAPKEFRTERMLNRLMKSNDIPAILKDSFLEALTLGFYEELDKHDYSFWKPLAKEYGKNFKENDKYFSDKVSGETLKRRFLAFFGAKSVTVPKATWDKLEDLRLKAGEYKPDEFKEEIKRLVREGTDSTESKLTREEYLTKRKFHDDSQKKFRLQHIKREEDRITKIGDTCDDRFLLNMSPEWAGSLDHYRNTDLIYRGSDGYNKLKDDIKKESNKELYKKRREQVTELLESHNVSEADREEILGKLGRMIERISDTDGELFEDERLECERINLERYGVRNWDAALNRLERLIPSLTGGSADSDIEKARRRFDKGVDAIKAYGSGKYKDIADILMDIPEVYSAVMNSDKAVLDKLLKDKIDPAFSAVAQTLPAFKKDEFHGEAIYKQYVYSNLRGIYTGRISGDPAYHMGRMKDFSKRMYSARINSNLKKVEEALNKKYAEDARHKDQKQFKAAGDEIVLTGEIKYTLMLTADNTERYEELLDPEKIVENALRLYEARKSNLNQNASFSSELTGKITNTSLGVDPLADKRKEYADKKLVGVKERNRYLDLNLGDIHEVKQGKSLVRVTGNGRNTVSLDKADADTVRGELYKQVDFRLPRVLADAIVEEGASRTMLAVKNFVKYIPDEPMKGTLYRHACRMNELYNALLKEAEKDPAMTEEEAQMYAVRIYSNKSDRPFFDYDSDSSTVSVEDLRKSEDYRQFRANYRKLIDLEKEEITDPSLKREQEDMSRNLRILLITNVGLNKKDSAGKSLRYKDLKTDQEKKDFGEAIGKAMDGHLAYLKYAAQVETVIRQAVEDYRKTPKNGASMFYKDSEVLSLREYYMSDMLKELKEGRTFDAAAWKTKVTSFYKDGKNRNALMSEKDSVCAEDLLKQEQERVETGAGENIISDIIRNSALIFHGRSNMYEQLDQDQKKFFAAALMLLDKGSIGMGTDGTGALLSGADKKKALMNHIGREIQKYIRGEEYHINIDYRDAAYKLLDYQNVGMMSLKREYVISREAYDQALLFARTMYGKKQSFNKGEKDMDRIRDGYSSIEAAFFQTGAQQKNIIDDLEYEPLTKEDVLARLIEFAKSETPSKWGMVVGAGLIAAGGATALAGSTMDSRATEKAKREAEKKGIDKSNAESSIKDQAEANGVATVGLLGTAAGLRVLDKSSAEYSRMKKVLERLEKLEKDDEDLKLFLRIMQDRTVLDTSTGNSASHADQEKRDLLFNALTGDMSTVGETIKGFDDNESCHQALINALSFQLRDDAYFKGKVISKEHFAKGSLNRKSVVDWELLHNAFEFMDQVKERRAEVYVTGNASELIRAAGNQKAISELDKLESEYAENKEKFDRNAIEDKLKSLKSVSLGYMSGRDEEIERAWSGYLSLSDQDKNLFYKVLQHRDLLDISKKNYVKNYFGISDRNYLNPTGRNKLLNEYIQASLSEGTGVTLDKDAYYQAMKSLLSTQVSDIVDYKDKKDLSGKISGIFSYERLGFFGRGGAIDWKLFKRALNFVKRAKAELKTQEGNALLYQGAGDLAENGQIDVDYSLLRRNIHKTGNQVSRFIGKLTVNRVKENLGLNDILDTVCSIVNVVDTVGGIIGLSDEGYLGKGIHYLKSGVNEAKDINKALGKEGSGFVALNVQSKEEYEKEKKEAKKTEKEKEEEKRKAEEAERKRREELKFYDRIKEGFDNIVTQKNSVEGAVKSMRTFLSRELNVYMAGELEKKSASDTDGEPKEKNLVQETVGDKKLKEKGDIRDLKNKAEKTVNDISNISIIVDNIPFVSNLKGILVYGVEKAVYGSILNNKLIHNDIEHDKDGKELHLTRSKEIEALKKNAADYAKEQVEKLTVDIFGKNTADKVKVAEEFLYNNKGFIQDGVKFFTTGLDYAKKSVEHVKNISRSVNNYKSLSKGAKDAATHRGEDDEKLRKAGEKRLNEKQLEKASNTLDMHRGMGSMADKIAEAMQVYNIGQDVINLTIDSVNAFGGKLNYSARFISGAIQDGLELAMFAIRVCTDRKALQDYFFLTDEGRRTVNDIRSGFLNAKNAGSKSAKKNADKITAMLKDYSLGTQVKNADMIDLIADAQGYEHTSELVEDVGMSMAQSLVFCASKFNPMMETKLMAITVMSVMGLSPAEIGSTSPEVARKLFESFKMSR